MTRSDDDAPRVEGASDLCMGFVTTGVAGCSIGRVPADLRSGPASLTMVISGSPLSPLVVEGVASACGPLRWISPWLSLGPPRRMVPPYPSREARSPTLPYPITATGKAIPQVLALILHRPEPMPQLLVQERRLWRWDVQLLERHSNIWCKSSRSLALFEEPTQIF